MFLGGFDVMFKLSFGSPKPSRQSKGPHPGWWSEGVCRYEPPVGMWTVNAAAKGAHSALR